MLRILSVLLAKDYLNGKRSIIELGAKDVSEKLSEIEFFMKKLKKDNIYSSMLPYIVNGRLSSRYIWESIGIDSYESIDLYDDNYNSLKFDLNKDFFEEYRFEKKFDIVTNFGCSEHVSDQIQVFKNIHNLTAVEGIIINSIPLRTYVDHSFYSYHPNFFYSLAKVNSYEILEAFLENRFIFTVFNYKTLNYLYGISDDLYLTIVYRKTKDNPFVIPYEIMDKSHETVCKQKNFQFFEQYLLYNGISKKSNYTCVIFGTEKAGEIAYDFCCKYNIKVLSFIDDFKTGYFKNIPIYNRTDFVQTLLPKYDLDFVLKGPFQRGVVDKDELNLPIIHLPMILVD